MDKTHALIDGNVQYLFATAEHTDVQCVPHMHVTMEIVLVTRGSLEITINENTYCVEQGSGAFIPPFSSHSFASRQSNHCYVLMFSKELVPYFFEFLQHNAPAGHIFPIPQAYMTLNGELLSRTKNDSDCMAAQTILAPLCYQIRQGCRFLRREKPMEDALSSALEYMYHHFTESLSLSQVAQAIGIHPVTLSKLFSRHCGVNYNFYLQYLRCSHAANLIKSRNISLSDAALSSGFGSIRSFNRAFLSIYGLTPSQYRRSDHT